MSGPSGFQPMRSAFVTCNFVLPRTKIDMNLYKVLNEIYSCACRFFISLRNEFASFQNTYNLKNKNNFWLPPLSDSSTTCRGGEQDMKKWRKRVKTREWQGREQGRKWMISTLGALCLARECCSAVAAMRAKNPDHHTSSRGLTLDQKSIETHFSTYHE